MPVDHETVSLGAFEFQCGETIPDLELAYETYGEFEGDNAVLVCHALTGSAHVASQGRFEDSDQAYAWWDDIVGPGKAIDTTEYFVVCVNVPGSCYGSSGPPSTNPETGDPYGPEFPPVTVADWTEAQRALLDELGIPHLYAVVGGSVGGMNVLEWAKRHPDHVEKLVPIAAAGRLDPQCLALDGIARRAITTDPNWNGGTTTMGTTPTRGWPWPARSVTSCTSRNPAWSGASAAGRPPGRPSGPSRSTPPGVSSRTVTWSRISTTTPRSSSSGSTPTATST
ncbi:alpha/beta fold hydrolase family protein [Halomicroarcula sp. GCM10025709]|uniref:homoserine O-acetyltransferase family protein n=1 Tax=Halomicroarcula sp. GCM10025709 TaxID=3252669 RepID=UPI0036242B39